MEVEKPCTLFWFYLSFLYSIYSANLVSLSRSPWNPTGWSSEDEGLRKKIQQPLDYVRVVGNNAVHPRGKIDLKDDIKTALTLFRLVNMIVEDMITNPKEMESLFNGLPDDVKKGIDRRDANNNKNSNSNSNSKVH